MTLDAARIATLFARSEPSATFLLGTVDTVDGNDLGVTLDADVHTGTVTPAVRACEPAEGSRVVCLLTATRLLIALAVLEPVSPEDTGWVVVPFEAGFTGTAFVRRIGSTVLFRGSMTTTLAPSGSSSVILTIPVGFRPTNGGDGAVTFRPSGNTASIAGGISTSGALGCRNSDSTARSILSMSATYRTD